MESRAKLITEVMSSRLREGKVGIWLTRDNSRVVGDPDIGI